MPSYRILGFSFFVLLAVIVGWEWVKYSHSQKYSPNDVGVVEILPEPNVIPEESVALQNTSPLSESPLPVGSTASLVNPASELPTLPAEVRESVVIPAPNLPTSISSQSVLLKATEDVWIEVKDNEGNIIISRLFRPTESYEFKNPQHLVLKTGNAGGISLISGDKSISSLGKTGEVKSGIILDPEKWVEQNPETH